MTCTLTRFSPLYPASSFPLTSGFFKPADINLEVRDWNTSARGALEVFQSSKSTYSKCKIEDRLLCIVPFVLQALKCYYSQFYVCDSSFLKLLPNTVNSCVHLAITDTLIKRTVRIFYDVRTAKFLDDRFLHAQFSKFI